MARLKALRAGPCSLSSLLARCLTAYASCGAQVKGPIIVREFFGGRPAADKDGWYDTGDVATLDEWGFMHITDRSKDVIKSGAGRPVWAG